MWLAEERRRLAQRQVEKLQGRRQDKDQATRKYENHMGEQQEARNSLDAFKNYKLFIDLMEHQRNRSIVPCSGW